MRARLRKVRSSTVTKELSALRQFVKWLEEMEALPKGDVTVPSVPSRSLGTAFHQRKRSAAIALSPEECEAIIAKLPAWSNSRKVERFPIRARFVVAYDTGLRPSTLDEIETPKHYRKGSATIMLTPDVDKNRFGREVPLKRRSREALDAVLAELPDKDGKPYEGPIFGWHVYRDHLKAAALEVLGPERAEKFNGAHLRSARITHALELSGGNLPGVQYLAGHKRATTTAAYVRPSLRAALDVLKAEESSGSRRK